MCLFRVLAQNSLEIIEKVLMLASFWINGIRFKNEKRVKNFLPIFFPFGKAKLNYFLLTKPNEI